MSGPGFFFPQQGTKEGRRIHADGTISIVCRICERVVARQLYRGFSTVICSVCAGLQEGGKTAEEIREEVRKREEQLVQDLYNHELGGQTFRAKGLGERITDKVKQIRQRLTRKRRPLLEEKDVEEKKGGK